jgi:OOP family OmpA-OmpF porin
MKTSACFKPVTLALALSAMLATVAFAQPTSVESIQSSPGDSGLPIAVLGARFESLVNVAPGQGRIVLFRPAGTDKLSGSTGVFINERFHTSMVAGGYTYLCMVPGQAQIGARQIKVGERAKDPVDSVTPLQVNGGQTIYLRVSDLSGRPVLAQVAESEALRQLANLREQVHAVSRVEGAQRCESAPVQQGPTERLTLAADALFQFGRSDIDALTGIGHQAIQQLIQRVGRDYDRIDRIHVIGHADPIGRPESNMVLSQQRADTIRQYLQNQGMVNANTPITSEGRGSTQPAVTGCGLVATPAAVRCHQPNRRVEVEVTGLRRPNL